MPACVHSINPQHKPQHDGTRAHPSVKAFSCLPEARQTEAAALRHTCSKTGRSCTCRTVRVDHHCHRTRCPCHPCLRVAADTSLPLRLAPQHVALLRPPPSPPTCVADTDYLEAQRRLHPHLLCAENSMATSAALWANRGTRKCRVRTQRTIFSTRSTDDQRTRVRWWGGVIHDRLLERADLLLEKQ
jgi:hypothetical protein